MNQPSLGNDAALAIDLTEAYFNELGKKGEYKARVLMKLWRRQIKEIVQANQGKIVRQEKHIVLASFRGLGKGVVPAVSSAHQVRSQLGNRLRIGVVACSSTGGSFADQVTPRRCKAAFALNSDFEAGDLRVDGQVGEQLLGIAKIRELQGEQAFKNRSDQQVFAVGAINGVDLPSRTGTRKEPDKMSEVEDGEFAKLWNVARQLGNWYRKGRTRRGSCLGRTFSALDAVRRWDQDDNIIGIGVGLKHLRATRADGLVLKIFVRKKLPLSMLSSSTRIPSFLSLPGVDTVPTDVEEVDIPNGQQLRDFARPASGGFCIGHHLLDGGGSIACLARLRAQPDGPLFILSAAHVLAPPSLCKPKDEIWQRCKGFGGGPREKIAELADFVSLNTWAVFRADAAIAGPVTLNECSPRIALVGAAPKGTAVSQIGDSVKLVGAGSERLTQSTVYSKLAFNKVFIGGIGQVLFEDIVACSVFTSEGDSGAAVLDDEDRMIGLHIAGNSRLSYSCLIDHVCDALDIDVVTVSGI